MQPPARTSSKSTARDSPTPELGLSTAPPIRAPPAPAGGEDDGEDGQEEGLVRLHAHRVERIADDRGGGAEREERVEEAERVAAEHRAAPARRDRRQVGQLPAPLPAAHEEHAEAAGAGPRIGAPDQHAAPRRNKAPRHVVMTGGGLSTFVTQAPP